MKRLIRGKGVLEFNGKYLYVHFSWYQVLALFMRKFRQNWDITLFRVNVGRLNKRLEMELGFFGVLLFANLYLPFLKGKTDAEYDAMFRELVKNVKE